MTNTLLGPSAAHQQPGRGHSSAEPEAWQDNSGRLPARSAGGKPNPATQEPWHPKGATLNDIVVAVSQEFGLLPSELKAMLYRRGAIAPRWAVARIARAHGFSYPLIAACLGYMNHTAVMYACRVSGAEVSAGTERGHLVADIEARATARLARMAEKQEAHAALLRAAGADPGPPEAVLTRRSRKRRLVPMAGLSRPCVPGGFRESRLAEMVCRKPEPSPATSQDSRARLPARPSGPGGFPESRLAEMVCRKPEPSPATSQDSRARLLAPEAPVGIRSAPPRMGRPRLHATPEIARQARQDKHNTRRRRQRAEERENGEAAAPLRDAAETPRYRSRTGYVNACGEIVLWGD